MPSGGAASGPQRPPPCTPPSPCSPQERMHVVWQEMVNSGLLSPSDFVRVTSTAAAQIFNVYPRKGVVSVAVRGA